MATRQLLPQRKPRGGRERREGQASKARRGERQRTTYDCLLTVLVLDT